MRVWLALVLLVPILAGCVVDDSLGAPKDLVVTSPTVQHEGSIPRDHTCDGANRSPQIDVTGLPLGTAAVALVVDDPDAPRGTFVHWLVWNVPFSGGSVTFPEGRVPQGALEGSNGVGRVGYAGPCPPQGDGAHRYRFKAYALDRRLDLGAGADKDALVAAMEGHIVAWGELVGTYARAG